MSANQEPLTTADPAAAPWAGQLAAASVADAAWARSRLAAAGRRMRSGKPADRLLNQISERLVASAAVVAQRSQTPLSLTYPEALPVSELRDDVLATLAERGMVVLTGETGSGKTTQLPKMLLEAGYGRRGTIAMTQPRRVAAVTVAARVAEELEVAAPVVASSVRFDDRSDASTLVRIATDGLLLAEAAADPDLRRYDAVVIDEAHERSLNIDLLLGLLRGVRERRPDLAVVVTSATIDAQRIADYLADAAGPAPVLHASGRTFPVEIDYRDPGSDDLSYLSAAVSAVAEVHAEGGRGDVLVFLPTERDIIEARRRLDDLTGATVLPLFGRLTPKEQQRVFGPVRGRKIVLATNVAETSLTVPGITVVIDAGLARIKRYQATTRTERLPVEPVAQASCDQRAGRAGRVEAGRCLRLYSEADYQARPRFAEPELRRSNLAGVQLQLLARGLGRGEDFPWLDAPAGRAWATARAVLDELGALAGDRLTTLGKRLARLPADPQIARILLAGLDEGTAGDAATVAAWLSIQEPRVRPPEEAAAADKAQRAFVHEAGDVAAALKLWDAWLAQASNSRKQRFCREHFLGWRRMREWGDVRHQFVQSLRDEVREDKLHAALAPSEPDARDLDGVHRCVLAGLVSGIARWDADERCYRTLGGKQAWLHPGSALRTNADGGKRERHPPWLVAAEVVETSRRFLRGAAPVDPTWILRLLGDRVKRSHRDPHFDEQSGRVVAIERILWKGLVLRDDRPVAYAAIDPDQAVQIFAEQALAGDRIRARLPVLAANRELVARCASLAARLRDPTHAVDPQALAVGYQRALAGHTPPVASVPALKRWLREHGDSALRLNPADLVDGAAWDLAEQAYPTTFQASGRTWPLAWRYVPGEPDDGATLTLSTADLSAVDAEAIDAAVPGWAATRVEALLRSLPKAQRRHWQPLREHLPGVLAAMQEQASGSLTQRLGAVIRYQVGPLAPLDESVAGVPAWARLRIVVRAADGSEVASGRGAEVLGAAAGADGDALLAARSQFDGPPLRAWPTMPADLLPARVEIAGRRWLPVLVRDRDADARVAVRRSVVADANAAAAWHADGIATLLEAHFDDDLLAIAEAPGAPSGVNRSLGAEAGTLRRGLAVAVLQHAAAEAKDLAQVRDAEAFAACCQAGLAALRVAVGHFDALIRSLDAHASQLQRALKRGSRSLAGAGAQRSVAADHQRLLGTGWWQRLDWPHVQRLPVYLEALQTRAKQADDQHFAKRLLPRRERLLARWHDAIELPDPRLLQALGLRPSVRAAAGALEEALVALLPGGASGRPPAGSGEALYNRLLGSLEDQVRRFEGETGDMLGRLREIRPYVDRAAPGPRRDQLCEAIDGVLRGYPDVSLGADLVWQREQLQELLTAGRAWLQA